MNKRQNRIAFVLGTMNRGGAERVISILSRKYAKQGWRTDICTLLSGQVDYNIDSSTEFHDFSGNGGSRIKLLPYWLRSIRAFVKENNPDVIVSFAARINIITMIACIGLHKKIVVSERNDPLYDGRGMITKILTLALYPFASSVVFQSKRVMSYFPNNVKKKGRVIPNPIQVTAYAQNADKGKIVTVGSLKPQKNHMLLIDAFAGVLQKYPDMQLYIYGEGSFRQQTEEHIRKMGLSEKVHMPGEMSDVHREIQDANIFVLSSDYEGLSNALLEAMVMGLPCISTNCAGSDEYIVNGKNGILTPVGDAFALSEAIIVLIENEELRNIVAENAKEVESIVGADSSLRLWGKVIDR